MFAKFRLWIADGLRAVADFIHEEEFDPEEFEAAMNELAEITEALEAEMEEAVYENHAEQSEEKQETSPASDAEKSD